MSECGVSDAHLLPLLSHLPQVLSRGGARCAVRDSTAVKLLACCAVRLAACRCMHLSITCLCCINLRCTAPALPAHPAPWPPHLSLPNPRSLPPLPLPPTQLRTALLGSNHRLTVAVVEALAAGPARTCLQELSVTGLELDGPALERVLPLLAALQRLDVSAAACLGGDVGDAEALLAAAQAAPSLHTLT